MFGYKPISLREDITLAVSAFSYSFSRVFFIVVHLREYIHLKCGLVYCTCWLILILINELMLDPYETSLEDNVGFNNIGARA